MAELVVSVPTKRVSAWSVETNPKYARAWLASLSPIHNIESANELYQSLYALNRMELEVDQRFALMELYRGPIQETVDAFEPLFSRASFPLSKKLHQLAEFICQCHLEMAHGYKLCVRSLSRQWFPWRRARLLVPCAERALYHLGEVLLHSYRSYLPYPSGIWRDAHALYRFVDRAGRTNQTTKIAEQSGTREVSVSKRYRQLLMLGIANPYQMPFNECMTVSRFVAHWIDQVRIVKPASKSDGGGCFVIDFNVDTPPVARAPNDKTNTELRILDASEFVRSLHVFLRRLEKGEPVSALRLGVEGLDSACHDMLQRLHRAYAQTASRRHSRIKRHETVFVCSGLNAIHFFSSGQKSIAIPAASAKDSPLHLDDVTTLIEPGRDEEYVALDEPGNDGASPSLIHENFRIDRWQVRDVSPQGLLLAQDGSPGVRFRVGDAVGVQRANTPGQWSVGIVRWLKSQTRKGMEVGVELIAPDVTAVSLRPVGANDSVSIPALMLPAIEAARRPASVLVPRGVLQVGGDFFFAEADGRMRRMRVMDAAERTGSIERVIVGGVLK